MQYPDDSILVARGKYSTLGRERKTQLERAHKVCTTLMTACSQALRDCEQRPPANPEPFKTIGKCLDNLNACRDKLTELCTEMETLKALAWDGDE